MRIQEDRRQRIEDRLWMRRRTEQSVFSVLSAISHLSSVIRPLKLQKGVTLIELLLYVAIVAMLMATLVPFAWNVINGGVKSQTQQEISSQARYVSERIKYEIRNANTITSVNTPPGTLKLDTTTNSTTVIDVSGGKVRISYGNPGTPIELNSSDTNVTSLTFTDYTSGDNNTKHVGFAFTMQQAYTGEQTEFQGTISVQSSAEVRSN